MNIHLFEKVKTNMDALKAGIEKVREAVETKTANEKFEKINDPNVKPSERMDAEFEADQAAAKAAVHHAKAEEYKLKHINN
jgi:hypothetical protein